MISFGTKHNLPTTVPPAFEINTHLHAAWDHLRKVHNEAGERHPAWLNAQADAAAKESTMTISATLHQLAAEPTTK